MQDLVDWGIWRLLTDSSMRVTRAELNTVWTMRDFIEAHIVLDTIDLQAFRENKKSSGK